MHFALDDVEGLGAVGNPDEELGAGAGRRIVQETVGTEMLAGQESTDWLWC